MKILRFVHATIAQAFYRWALAEINPLHPDLGRVLIKERQHADRLRSLVGRS